MCVLKFVPESTTNDIGHNSNLLLYGLGLVYIYECFYNQSPRRVTNPLLFFVSKHYPVISVVGVSRTNNIPRYIPTSYMLLQHISLIFLIIFIAYIKEAILIQRCFQKILCYNQLSLSFKQIEKRTIVQYIIFKP